MTTIEEKNKDKLLNDILEIVNNITYIKPGDIPNIDLYMDQVTTFMDNYLSESKRYEDDKVLTKTMINNYAKNHILPPPEKKKYSPEHMMVLIFIYYLKNLLSINDVQTLLEPILDKHFNAGDDIRMSDIYGEIVGLCKDDLPNIENSIKSKFETAYSGFEGERDSAKLREFAFICLLSFDVFKKKQLIEKLLDDYYKD